MRAAVIAALVGMGACSFQPGAYSLPDALDEDGPPPPDVMVDTLVPTWAIDSTSQKAVPATGGEWTDLTTAYGLSVMAPDHLWLMQETAGSLGNAIGAVSLAPVNLPTYNNAVAGWSRRAVGTVDTSGNQGFITNLLGRLDSTPHLFLLYVAVLSTPGGERSLAGIGANTDHRFVSVTSARMFKATGWAQAGTTGTRDPGTTVHPIVIAFDPSMSKYIVYTDEEKLAVTWVPTSGASGLLMVGNAIIGAANARYLYGALWTGTKAQVDDAAVKKLLQSLGWTVSGY